MKGILQRSIGVWIVLVLMAGAFLLGANLRWVSASVELDQKLDIFMQVLDLVKTDYVDSKVKDGDLVYGAIKGTLGALDDPYTRFMEPEPFKEMKMRLEGSYHGIGIYIGMKDHQLVVISPIKNTPAYRTGLKAKDKIVEIDGKSTKDMALEEAVTRIRGKKGTTVKLGILRGEAVEPRQFSIVRDQVEIQSVERKMLPEKIGYLRLITFEKKDSNEEVERALSAFEKEKAAGLILDVRNNGGGLLDNAISIAGLFMDSGEVVHTVDRFGKKETKRIDGERIWKHPLVLLVNENSASASEILAGAIQDNHVAKVVGTKTFGKASVQKIIPLEDGSAILLTIQKYLTPKGRDIHKKGIDPDVVADLGKAAEKKEGKKEAEKEEESPLDLGVDLTPEEMLAKDVQLRKAVEVLQEVIDGSIKNVGGKREHDA